MSRRLLADVAFLALALAVLAWVTWDAFQFRLITYSPGSDYWEHTAVLRALLDDPWHPRHPLLAIDAASPRFGPHFLLVALAGRALGFDAIDTMALGSVVNTVLLLAGIYCFFRTYFRTSLASLVGLVVFFGSWLDAPHFSNVYKLKVYFSVAGYPSSAALAVTLLGLALETWLLRQPHRRNGWLVVSGLVWGYVYITHPLTATMALPAAVFLAWTEPGVARERRLWVAGAVVAGFLATPLWPYYPALGMVLGGTAHRMRGFEPPEPLHEFYAPGEMFQILGYCLISLAALPYFWVRRRHVFTVLGTLLMLLVFALGALVRIPLGHRYILLAVFLLQIALVALLLELLPAAPREHGWSRRPWLRAVAALGVAGLLANLAVENALEAREHFERVAAHADGRDSITLRYARRVGEVVPRDGVVLSTALASWPLPTFGPRVVTPLHTNPLIADSAERRDDAIRFFAPWTRLAEREAILARYGVTHVLVPPRTNGAVWRVLDRGHLVERLPGGFLLYAVGPRARNRPHERGAARRR